MVMPPDPLALECGDPPDGAVAAIYKHQPSVSGGNPGYMFSADGLPDGLTIDPASGQITGEVTLASTEDVRAAVAAGHEEIVTTMASTIGPEGNLLEPSPEACRQIAIEYPILHNDQVARLRHLPTGSPFRSTTLPLLYDPAEGGAGLERAMADLCRRASDAVRAGYGVIILSDRGVDATHAPIELSRDQARVLGDREDDVLLTFANGKKISAKLVIGADGINSVIRDKLLGVEKPRFSGWIGHRALVNMDKLRATGLDYERCVKWWWDKSRHIMAYATKNDASEYYYVTGVPVDSWDHDASFVDSSREEMEAIFGDNLRALLTPAKILI
mgnify:CR=1 FL=1